MSKAMLFTKRGCTPCLSLKKFLLAETDLEFEEYDAEKDIEKLQEYDVMTVPTLIIGDKRITGFKPQEVMKLINNNG